MTTFSSISKQLVKAAGTLRSHGAKWKIIFEARKELDEVLAVVYAHAKREEQFPEETVQEAISIMKFALDQGANDGHDFMNLWMARDFDTIREEYPEYTGVLCGRKQEG